MTNYRNNKNKKIKNALYKLEHYWNHKYRGLCIDCNRRVLKPYITCVKCTYRRRLYGRVYKANWAGKVGPYKAYSNKRRKGMKPYVSDKKLIWIIIRIT